MRRLHLPIQDPCHEDWDAMNRTEGASRFCGSCAKHVHDVSAMSEPEARAVLAEESKRGRVCVRYTVDSRTGAIKYKVETVGAPTPTGFSSLLAAASVAVALLGSGCTGSEPTRVEADRCTYEVGPWTFTAERGEGTCPDAEPEQVVGQLEVVDNGQVIDVPQPETAVAGGLGAEPIEPQVMGEMAVVEPPPPPPENDRVTMGKIAAPPPTEHVKMGDVGPIDEPCDDTLAGQAGTTTTPNTPPKPDDRPRRL
ncbi:hypothetical protein ACNOYE_40035 [Nannocystaceae bacterium ST9]